jgi:DNA repair protein RadC
LILNANNQKKGPFSGALFVFNKGEPDMEYSQDAFWQDLKSGKFITMVRESAKGHTISNAQEVYHVLRPMVSSHDDVEILYGIFLDSKNHIIAIDKLSEGSINSSSVYPREIIKKVISHKAAALVLAHNHPSGSTEPSIEDRAITLRILFVMQAIGVSIHDHIIIGNGHHSMADEGVIAKMNNQFRQYMAGV